MIALTFVSSNQRGERQTYDTAILRDALHEFVDRNFKGEIKPGDPHPSPNGPDRWVFAIVIERNGNEYTRDEAADVFHDIAEMETARAVR